jgi:hypothetical protein
MSRLLSVMLTHEQVRARTKTVTRRLGWRELEPGDGLTLCKKVQGRRRKDGTVEPLDRIAEVVVVDVRRERLDAITVEDVALEGFPEWTPAQFVEFFCRSMKCTPDVEVTRILWRYRDTTPASQFDDRMLDNLAAAINLADPVPADLVERVGAALHPDGRQNIGGDSRA